MMSLNESIDPDRKELINLFMLEAKGKQSSLIDGLGKHPLPQSYRDAISLVDVSIAFEAFINILDIDEPKVSEKIKIFTEKYKDLFLSNKESLSEEIKNLKEELEKLPLKDMTPKSKRPNIKIEDEEDLEKLLKIIYRVRSNLVHGSKSLNSTRNQLLIKNSFSLLYKIVEIVLIQEELFS